MHQITKLSQTPDLLNSITCDVGRDLWYWSSNNPLMWACGCLCLQMASINHYKTKINTYKNQWMTVGSIRNQTLNITTKSGFHLTDFSKRLKPNNFPLQLKWGRITKPMPVCKYLTNYVRSNNTKIKQMVKFFVCSISISKG